MYEHVDFIDSQLENIQTLIVMLGEDMDDRRKDPVFCIRAQYKSMFDLIYNTIENVREKYEQDYKRDVPKITCTLQL